MKSRSTASTNLAKVKQAILFRRFLGASVVGMAVFVMAFVAVPYFVAEANATTEVSTGVAWGAVSLELDPDFGNGSVDDPGHGDVEFGNITPTSKNTTSGNYGTQRVIKKTIGVKTPGKYYSVYLSMTGNSNALQMDGTDMTIDAIDASWNGTGSSAPKAFSSTAWGFAVPTTQTGNYTTPFTDNYGAYDSLLGRDLTVSGTGSTAYNTTAWAAVPVSGNAQQIWKATTTDNNGFGERTEDEQTVTGDIIKDHFSVYYSVMVDTDKIAGTYANQVVYTAIASSQSLDQVSKNLSRSVEYVKEGTSETLNFDLSASATTIPRGKVKVYLVPHVLADHNDYESIEGFSTYAVAANECTTASDSDWVVTDHGATITCTMPASPNGVDDGVTAEGTITAGGDTLNVQKGEFDFWVTIADYGYNYISKYTRNTAPVASVVYAGLQSKKANNQPYFTEMQEMTATVCANTNKWGNTTTYNPTGNEATSDAAGTLTGTVTLYNPAGTALTSASIMTDGTKDDIGTFELTDSRDSKTYLVRKLADNNCWMVQNLDLDLAAAQAGTISLTNTNTDIDYDRTSGRTGWVPGATQAAQAAELGEGKTFADLTLEKLGTAQSTQFQSGDTYGANNHWGSKYANNVAYNDVTDTWDYSLNIKSLIDSSDLEVTSVTSKTENGVTTWTCTWAPKNRGWNSSTSRNGTVTTQSGSNTTTSTVSEADCRSKTPTAKGANWIENNSLAEMPRSYDNGDKYVTVASTGEGTTSGQPAASGNGSQHLGDYYNWYAATAESGTWDMASGKASDSICPYGWQLPENSGTKSWVNLTNTSYGITSGRLGSRKLRSFPLSVIMSGGYGWVGGGLYDRGTGGGYWSSTPYAATYSRYLYFSSTSVYPQNGGNKTLGFTVRCVAR